MKKFLILMCSVILVFGLTTCKEEGMEFDTNGGKGLAFVHFVGSTITISTELEDVDAHSAIIRVSSTVKSNSARTYNIVVDPSSTAIEGTHYTLSSKTVTIPAGEYGGSVTLTVVIDNLTKPVVSAILTLETNEAIDYGSKLSVNMNRYDLCDFDESMLVGTFNYFSSEDEWDESGTLTLEADPDDPYKIYILGVPSGGLDWNGNKIELNVQPYGPGLSELTLSGPRSVVAHDLSAYGWSYLDLAFEAVSGSFSVCDGTYTIYFRITVDAGSFGSYEFTFSK